MVNKFEIESKLFLIVTFFIKKAPKLGALKDLIIYYIPEVIHGASEGTAPSPY